MGGLQGSPRAKSLGEGLPGASYTERETWRPKLNPARELEEDGGRPGKGIEGAEFKRPDGESVCVCVC